MSKLKKLAAKKAKKAKDIIVRVLIKTPKGKILLLKRAPYKKHPGTWDLPGGGVEKGESPKSAAKRETEEETGATVKSTEPIAQLKTKNRLRILFGTTAKKFKATLNHEHTKGMWVDSLDDLPDGIDMHPNTKRLIESHMKRTAE